MNSSEVDGPPQLQKRTSEYLAQKNLESEEDKNQDSQDSSNDEELDKLDHKMMESITDSAVSNAVMIQPNKE